MYMKNKKTTNDNYNSKGMEYGLLVGTIAGIIFACFTNLMLLTILSILGMLFGIAIETITSK